jgi:hypothetical protein
MQLIPSDGAVKPLKVEVSLKDLILAKVAMKSLPGCDAVYL